MPEVWGPEHITYIIVSTIIGASVLLLSFLFIKNEKGRTIVLKILAGLLFISILTNRLSQVFRYETVRWYTIIPDSYCGMTSLVLSLSVMIGKKNNCALHFVWLLGLLK